MRFFYLLLIPFFTYGQVDTCYVSRCDTVSFTSTFDPSLTHAWSCSDGNTSSSVNPTFEIDGNVTCVLTVSGPSCDMTKTIFVVNCPDSCGLIVNISLTGTTLLAALQNCEGSPNYQWQKYNGSTWENIGSNSPTFNTAGIEAEYKVIVDCGFGCTAESIIDYTVPCTLSVTGFTNTTGNNLQVITTGCTDTLTYDFYYESPFGAANWTIIHTDTTTATTYTYNSPGPSSYKVVVTGCGCEAERYYNFNPCIGFTGSITPLSNRCAGDDVFFTIASNNQPIASSVWAVDGTPLPSNAYGPATVGTHIVTVTMTSVNGCTFVASTTLIVNSCCVASNSITPTSTTVCTNQNVSFTTTNTSGTGPFTYNWTYSQGGAPISFGTGTSKTFNFASPGTVSIVAAMTDALGCTSTSSATLTVNVCADCNCTPTLALSGCNLNATFGGCTGYAYILEYSTTGSSWSTIQSGAATNFTYTPTANGLFRVTATKATCQNAVTSIINVTCYVAPCSNPPTLDILDNFNVTCNLTQQVFPGNTIGGSATSVTVTDNGGGTNTLTWQNATTFTVRYTPVSGDIGNTVTLTITTNNPLGAPCLPVTKTIGVQVSDELNPIITSSNDPICYNTQRTITYSPPGGTLTVQSGPGVLVGNVLTATDGGVITLLYNYTSDGCSAGYLQDITALRCTPSLSLDGCELALGSTGAYCGLYTYVLQYSANGTTGWSTVLTGVAGGFTGHTPTVNGYYRLGLINDSCPAVFSTVVNVTCVITCDCVPATLVSGCSLAWSGCAGYTATLQKFSGSWTNVTTTSPFTVVDSTEYRVQYTKTGCTTQFSNTVVAHQYRYTTITYTDIYLLDYSAQDGIPSSVLNSYKCNGDTNATVFLIFPSNPPFPPSLNTIILAGDTIFNTFNSTVPVVWSYTSQIGDRPEFEIHSQTPTELIFSTSNPGIVPLNTPKCTTGTQQGTRVKGLIEARNACGVLLWSGWVHWWGST